MCIWRAAEKYITGAALDRAGIVDSKHSFGEWVRINRSAFEKGTCNRIKVSSWLTIFLGAPLPCLSLLIPKNWTQKSYFMRLL
jgi:hypothetical protein